MSEQDKDKEKDQDQGDEVADNDTTPKDNSDLPDLDDNSPAQADSAAAPVPAADPATAQPAQAPQQVATATPSAMPQAAPTQPAAAPAGQDNTVDVLGVRPPAQNALQGYAQNMAFQQDLAGGKITPETYHSLFENKSTLGKLGTLFGLALSGAGSGLAHQPNMLMDMMNNEINRDLDAQKTNQSNKQNWFNAAMAHEKSLSDIATNAATEQAIRIGTYNSALDAEKKNYNNSVTPGLHRLGATTDAQNNMSSAALQYYQDNVNRMAPGPSKIAGQAMIDNTLRPAVNAQIMKNQVDLAQRKAAIHQMVPNPLTKALAGNGNAQPIDPRGPAIDNQKYQQGITLGRTAGPGVPGAIPPEQVSTINNEANMVAKNRNVYADWEDTFNKLQNMKAAGQVPAGRTGVSLLGLIPGSGAGAAALGGEAKEAFERARNVQKESFKQRLGTGLSGEEKEAMANSMLPAWNDSGDSESEAHRKGVQHFKTLESSTQNLDQYGLKTPFPEMNYTPSKKSKASAANQNSPVTQKNEFDEQYNNAAH